MSKWRLEMETVHLDGVPKRSKGFSPPPGPQENALFGADVHDFRIKKKKLEQYKSGKSNGGFFGRGVFQITDLSSNPTSQ